MRRFVILRNGQSPGDVVMLTAAVRDLHRSCPGSFITDVRTPCPALWEHNPYVTPLDQKDARVEVIDCHYPLIHRSNQGSYHFIQGFMEYLGDKLGVRITPTDFKGDIYLSESERAGACQVAGITELDVPFWIVVAGGKYDFTTKWWPRERFQEVVDRFRERIVFVQVGEHGHYHPALRGVVDLRGKTSLRELVRLVFHSIGVLCPVTLVMHLAAAVETRGGAPSRRPCVVVAGGREPTQWEAYPQHQFIHTIGALQCCMNGGCWRSRVKPLGDGEEGDASLCVDVINAVPRCMEMITPDDVARRIETYFDGGALGYLRRAEWRKAEPALTQ